MYKHEHKELWKAMQRYRGRVYARTAEAQVTLAILFSVFTECFAKVSQNKQKTCPFCLTPGQATAICHADEYGYFCFIFCV